MDSSLLENIELPAFARRWCIKQGDDTLLRVLAGDHCPSRKEIVSTITEYLKQYFPGYQSTQSYASLLNFQALAYTRRLAEICHPSDVVLLIREAFAELPASKRELEYFASDQVAEWLEDRRKDPPTFGAYPSPYEGVTTKRYLKDGVSIEMDKWNEVMLKAKALKTELCAIIREANYVAGRAEDKPVEPSPPAPTRWYKTIMIFKF